MLNRLCPDAEITEHVRCGYCRTYFSARIYAWVDVARMPLARRQVLDHTFNVVQCPFCNSRRLPETFFFFYEDFARGMLIAISPRISSGSAFHEQRIREQYGHYPLLDFFYDMTQLWVLVFLQEYYCSDPGIDIFTQADGEGTRLRRLLRFIKTHPLMSDIRERLLECTGAAVPAGSHAELAGLLRQAIRVLEWLYPWPEDQRCRCGEVLPSVRAFTGNDEEFITQPSCRLTKPCGTTCPRCGSVYSSLLGTVTTYGRQKDSARGRQVVSGAGSNLSLV